jgi:WD40 repeat protein
MHNGPDCVNIWDAASGKTIRTYQAHTHAALPGPVNSLSWSPDGRYLASAAYDYTVRVWDVASGNLRFLYSDPHGFLLTCVTWSPDSKALGNDDNGSGDVMVQVWNISSQRPMTVYRGQSRPVQTVDWSPDGQYIASGGNDTTVQVWHALTGRHVLTYAGHNPHSELASTVLAVNWSPAGTHIASCGQDSTVQIWHALSGERLATYHGHAGDVYAAIGSPGGQYIASGGDDTTVQVWQTAGVPR